MEVKAPFGRKAQKVFALQPQETAEGQMVIRCSPGELPAKA